MTLLVRWLYYKGCHNANYDYVVPPELFLALPRDQPIRVVHCFSSLEQTKNAILPELVELTNDEESFVRIAGIETVASMMTLLDDGQF